MAVTLGRYHESSRGSVDLSGTQALAGELGAAIRTAALADRSPADANRVILGLCRLLIPVNYTRSGPFEQDLALGSPPLPGLADVVDLAGLDPATDQFHFLRTKLVRERNRVEHALRAALRLVDAG